jgi:hypothetical protein
VKRNFCRLALALILTVGSFTLAGAQTGGGASVEAPGTSARDSPNRTSANDSFELNITERRIIEHDFAASTTVEVGEETARGLLLRVGVAVGADEINVLLRNVRGRVTFRASMARVLERLNARRAPGVAP